MGRFWTVVALSGLVAGLAAGCGRGQTPIPPGAQQVHVAVSASTVSLNPGTVRAGDIYVVLDTPGSSVGFVQAQHAETETPGPLSDEDLQRLSRGDTQGTAIGGFDDVGCSASQRAEDRGQMGPCGNVFKVVLTAGEYAFFIGDLEHGPGGEASITVLEVLP